MLSHSNLISNMALQLSITILQSVYWSDSSVSKLLCKQRSCRSLEARKSLFGEFRLDFLGDVFGRVRDVRVRRPQTERIFWGCE